MIGAASRPRAPVAEGGTDGTGSPGFGGRGRLVMPITIILTEMLSIYIFGLLTILSRVFIMKAEEALIRELAIICLGLITLGLYFLGERLAVNKKAGRPALRIGITGTRGKSTVTRLVAAALREAGYSVLAKTTGSKPVLILPDGTETEVVRRGRATVLEQKKVLKKAADLGVQALVTELMNIHPERGSAESRRILQPNILVITNVRLDHREEMGRTKRQAAASLAAVIPPGATVFVPETEFYPEFERAAGRVQSNIVRVATSRKGDVQTPYSPLFSVGFPGDADLVLAVARHLGLPEQTARRGMAKARPDFGSLKVWEAPLGRSAGPWLLVNAFAANEPESTGLVLERLQEGLPLSGRPFLGILNFRADRGDRTRQWVEAIDRKFFSGFQKIYLIGAHIHALEFKKRAKGSPRLIPLGGRSAPAIMDHIAAGESEAGVLVGMGNVGGLGAALVEHWEAIGRTYAV
jgi:poly-gamma-glutamate synthase PgsB/CapB